MEIKDRIQKALRGVVKIIQRNLETGEKKFVNSNLVLDLGYQTIAYLLSHDTTYFSVSKIDKISFGMGINPPAEGDTSLYWDPVYDHPGSLQVTPSYPDTYSVLFTAEWGGDKECIAPITQLGLFTVSNILFAETLFVDSYGSPLPMTKPLGWTWEIMWSLTYRTYS